MDHTKVMEDKRVFTNYSSNALFNHEIKEKKNFKTNEQYRKYLVNNANNIMHVNRNVFMNENNVYIPNKESLDLFKIVKNKQNYPYLFDNVFDNNVPSGYETNETKINYLSRNELLANQYNKYKKL